MLPADSSSSPRHSTGIRWHHPAWRQAALCVRRSNRAQNHSHHQEGEALPSIPVPRSLLLAAWLRRSAVRWPGLEGGVPLAHSCEMSRGLTLQLMLQGCPWCLSSGDSRQQRVVWVVRVFGLRPCGAIGHDSISLGFLECLGI